MKVFNAKEQMEELSKGADGQWNNRVGQRESGDYEWGGAMDTAPSCCSLLSFTSPL